MMTARRAETLRKAGFHAAGGVSGLYLAITGDGGRSWVLRYSFGGTRRNMGLGPCEIIGLAEARELAATARRKILAGIDPLEERRAGRDAARLEAAKRMTFASCAEAYIKAHESGWNVRQAPQWRASLRDYVDPVFGDLPVSMVDTALVMRAIEPIWNAKPETANRTRGRIENILDWAAVSGYRPAGDNPARWRGHIEHLLPARLDVKRVEHHAALPYAEVGALIAELRQRDSIQSRALEFAILTSARAGEVIGARWSEFDIAERMWTIPAGRMKAKREHRSPLSDAAMAIVEKMAEIRSGDLVFPGVRGGTIGALGLRRALAATGTQVTVHGFRSAFRTWAAERTNFPREVAELALAHAVGDAVERAYQRSDMFNQRRQIMDAWAKFCSVSATVTGGEKVVTLRR
jgi:integrase